MPVVYVQTPIAVGANNRSVILPGGASAGVSASGSVHIREEGETIVNPSGAALFNSILPNRFLVDPSGWSA
jgi:hypothetical protein